MTRQTVTAGALTGGTLEGMAYSYWSLAGLGQPVLAATTYVPALLALVSFMLLLGEVVPNLTRLYRSHRGVRLHALAGIGSGLLLVLVATALAVSLLLWSPWLLLLSSGSILADAWFIRRLAQRDRRLL